MNALVKPQNLEGAIPLSKTHIMLDLETLSSQPDAAIVAIGAVNFCGMRRSEFYRTIDPKSAQECGGRIDADTVKWWMKQSALARETTFLDKNAIETYGALRDFELWVKQFAFSSTVHVWGNGADFDCVVLRRTYERMHIQAPWKFQHSRCFRTLKSMAPDVVPAINDIPHNALSDAIAQADHAERIFEHLKVQP